MSYKSNIYQIMMASPSDVATERNIIREVIYEWNVINSFLRKKVLLPVGWETHSAPEMGARPQEIINKRVLKDCDLLVGVFWTRIGTATGEYPSGTIEEIEEFIEVGKPVMLYFSDTPVIPDSIDQAQYSSLKEFKENCRKRGLFESYFDTNDFKNKFSRQLQLKINQDQHFLDNEIVFNEELKILSIPDIPQLSREAQILLKEMSKDTQGMVLRSIDSSGFNVQTNFRNFVEDRTAKQRAIWENALDELESEGLIHAEGFSREIFIITKKGFEIADLINL